MVTGNGSRNFLFHSHSWIDKSWQLIINHYLIISILILAILVIYPWGIKMLKKWLSLKRQDIPGIIKSLPFLHYKRNHDNY